MGIAATQATDGSKGVINGMYLDVLRQAYAEVKASVPLQPKHHEWFTGKAVSQESVDSIERRVAQLLAKRMVAKMEVMGTKHFESFSSKMSAFRHNMQKSVVAGLIPGHITHGVCRIGQVVNVGRTHADVVRFYVTSGEVEIDPDKGEKYLGLVDRTVDKRMFYGMALTLDRNGHFIEINRDRFEDGVAFLTEDPSEALFNMSAVSTGRSVDVFRNMAASRGAGPVSRVPQPVAQPRF